MPSQEIFLVCRRTESIDRLQHSYHDAYTIARQSGHRHSVELRAEVYTGIFSKTCYQGVVNLNIS